MAIQKIRDSVTKIQGKAVVQYDLQGIYIQDFVSTKDAERTTGIPHNIISAICKGKRKPYKTMAFTFKYK